MSQFGAALAYGASVLLWVVLLFIYAPILVELGVPSQVAALSVGIGTLVLVAAGIAGLAGGGSMLEPVDH